MAGAGTHGVVTDRPILFQLQDCAGVHGSTASTDGYTSAGPRDGSPGTFRLTSSSLARCGSEIFTASTALVGSEIPKSQSLRGFTWSSSRHTPRSRTVLWSGSSGRSRKSASGNIASNRSATRERCSGVGCVITTPSGLSRPSVIGCLRN